MDDEMFDDKIQINDDGFKVEIENYFFEIDVFNNIHIYKIINAKRDYLDFFSNDGKITYEEFIHQCKNWLWERKMDISYYQTRW